MNDLRDTRKLVGRTVTDEFGIKGRYAMAAQEAVYELLAGNPGVELATIRFRVDAEHPPKVTVTGRVGSLVGPAGDPGELTYLDAADDLPRIATECPSCHQLPGRPPTEYCRRPDLHNVNEDGPICSRCDQPAGHHSDTGACPPPTCSGDAACRHCQPNGVYP